MSCRCTLQDPDSGESQQVAMKVLKPDLLSSPNDLKEFILEANLIRKLNHRCVVVQFRCLVLTLNKIDITDAALFS